MKTLKIEDLENLSIGAAILGSGGGGDPAYELMMAQHQMLLHGEVPLLTVDELEDDDLLVPVSFMGAPLVGIEKLPSGREFAAIFAMIEKVFGKRPRAILPAEIGGSNAFTPFCVAGSLSTSVLDADTIGRAFPELQMSSCNLLGISSSPTFLSDALGNCVMIEANNALATEHLARTITVSMGSNAAVALYLMTGKEAKRAVISGTISKAISLGKAVRAAQGNDPVQAILKLEGGSRLATGIITDIEQEVKDGFLHGSFTMKTGEGTAKVFYQNENLIAYLNGNVIAMTPDIIIPLDVESGMPITSESLKFGLKVDLVVLPAPEIWKTKEGLELVGPRYFGYDIDYTPSILQEAVL